MPKNQFVCLECIGDTFLKNDIHTKNTVQDCTVCKKTLPCISISELCDLIHEAFQNCFVHEILCQNRLLSLSYHHSNTSETVEDIISRMLRLKDKNLSLKIRQELSKQHPTLERINDPYIATAKYRERLRENFGILSPGAMIWYDFQATVQTKSRFLSKSVRETLDYVFEEIHQLHSEGTKVIRDAGPNSEIEHVFRARFAGDHDEISGIVQNWQFGAPPSTLAVEGRANPAGISMFYGALQEEPCIYEIRPAKGGYVITARFDFVRPARLLDLQRLWQLDLQKLRSPNNNGCGYFSPESKKLTSKLQMLKYISAAFAKPVMPNKQRDEYIPTQVIASYLSSNVTPPIDGIIYRSSQAPENQTAENVVLFPDDCLEDKKQTIQHKLSVSHHCGAILSPEGSGPHFRIQKEDRDNFPLKQTEQRIISADFEGEYNPILRMDLESIRIYHIPSIEITKKLQPIKFVDKNDKVSEGLFSGWLE